MTLCPNCGGRAELQAAAGGVDFWRCKGTCGKLFTHPAQTRNGSANGVSCTEVAGEFEAR